MDPEHLGNLVRGEAAKVLHLYNTGLSGVKSRQIEEGVVEGGQIVRPPFGEHQSLFKR